MNREILISYALYYGGEYDKIVKAISAKSDVPMVSANNAITIFDEAYPKRLLNLKYPPFVLFYKGNLKLLNSDCIGIVGSRIACEYALRATKDLVLANKYKTIVSGLAKGIDACAHENAIKTIGVLGCGIDYIYPMCNYDLIKRVEKEGLVISEYPGLTKPLGYHFPFRNRIISCLANKLYIMQSSIKSGTMSTLNEALELGTEIRVLPYDLYSEYGCNNNQLISEGAQIIDRDEIAF